MGIFDGLLPNLYYFGINGKRLNSNGEWHGKGTWYYPESDDGPPYSEDVEYVNGEEIIDNE